MKRKRNNPQCSSRSLQRTGFNNDYSEFNKFNKYKYACFK